jgi:hypothetical protein
MTRPTRDTAAGRAYLDLRQLGRQSNRDTGELLALYALEGFLDRLAVSDGAADFVLKGGVLLAAYDSRRPTRDVDLQATDLANDTATVLARVRAIAAITRADGLAYDTTGATAETIRDDDPYAGVRVSMGCALATARLWFHVDVNVGDPAWRSRDWSTCRGCSAAPSPSADTRCPWCTRRRSSPLCSGVRRTPAGATSPTSTSSAVDTGSTAPNSRSPCDSWRATAVPRCSPSPTSGGGSTGSAQTAWASWVRRQRLDDRLPGLFATVLDAVGSFADPPLLGAATGRTGDPVDRTWQPATRSF